MLDTTQPAIFEPQEVAIKQPRCLKTTTTMLPDNGSQTNPFRCYCKHLLSAGIFALGILQMAFALGPVQRVMFDNINRDRYSHYAEIWARACPTI